MIQANVFFFFLHQFYNKRRPVLGDFHRIDDDDDDVDD